MACTIVSRNYQIVIPKEVREQLGLRPGQEVEVVVEDGIAHLVPGDLPDREGAGKRAAVARSTLSRRILERRHGEPLPDSPAFIRAERERLAARTRRSLHPAVRCISGPNGEPLNTTPLSERQGAVRRRR